MNVIEEPETSRYVIYVGGDFRGTSDDFVDARALFEAENVEPNDWDTGVYDTRINDYLTLR